MRLIFTELRRTWTHQEGSVLLGVKTLHLQKKQSFLTSEDQNNEEHSPDLDPEDEAGVRRSQNTEAASLRLRIFKNPLIRTTKAGGALRNSSETLTIRSWKLNAAVTGSNRPTKRRPVLPVRGWSSETSRRRRTWRCDKIVFISRTHDKDRKKQKTAYGDLCRTHEALKKSFCTSERKHAGSADGQDPISSTEHRNLETKEPRDVEPELCARLAPNKISNQWKSDFSKFWIKCRLFFSFLEFWLFLMIVTFFSLVFLRSLTFFREFWLKIWTFFSWNLDFFW